MNGICTEIVRTTVSLGLFLPPTTIILNDELKHARFAIQNAHIIIVILWNCWQHS